MKLYKVGIIGYFAEGKSKAGGQEAKTCSLNLALRNQFGIDAVYNVDTTDWKKKPITLFVNMVSMIVRCQNIIMLPAQNSIKVFIPFFVFFNKIFHKNLYYSVVGGWLPDYLKDNTKLLKQCKKLKHIFVETKSMKSALENMGCQNIIVVPNFKFLSPVDSSKFNNTYEKPYRLCTFSRVMKEKGIEDIVEAVKSVNKERKEIVFTLDIYGKIDEAYLERFRSLERTFPTYIRYAGMVEPELSVETICGYFALVFPTHYNTEGVPGTLIDACMAGVPVVCALWKNYEDVFIEGKTGWGYKLDCQSDLLKILDKILDYPDEFLKMKKTSLDEAQKYLPKNNIQKIIIDFQ